MVPRIDWGLLLLVVEALLVCVSFYFFRAFFFCFLVFFLLFMVYVLCGNCKWSILSSLFFFSFLFSFSFFLSSCECPPIIINANNVRFAILCNRYFSAYEWRFIWCQFVADVKGNPVFFPVTAKYRQPYAITLVTHIILYIVTMIWRACRNSNRAHNYNRAVGRRALRYHSL